MNDKTEAVLLINVPTSLREVIEAEVAKYNRITGREVAARNFWQYSEMLSELSLVEVDK